MKIRVKLIYLMAGLFFCLNGQASEPASGDPLTFKLWKDHQIVEAKNQVVRLSNRIHLLKTGRYKSEEASQAPNGQPLLDEEAEADYQNLKVESAGKVVDKKTLAEAEKRVLESAQNRMKIALGNLQYAKELNVEDYLAVYLSQFKNDEPALRKVVKKLSDQELVEMIRGQMKDGTPSDKLPKPSNPEPNSVISELQPEPSESVEKLPKSL